MAILLATLRLAGVLGDQSDATGETQYAPASGGPVPLASGWQVLPDWDGAGTVEFVRFALRALWYPDDQGPVIPQGGPQWRLGAGSPVVSTVGFSPETPVGEIEEMFFDAPSAPGGGAWTQAAVNDLQMRSVLTANDGGSQMGTTVFLTELRAEIWGAAVVVREIEAVTLACDGDVAEGLACDDDEQLTLTCDVDEGV